MRNIILSLLFIVFIFSCEKEYKSIDAFKIEYSRTSGWVGYNYSVIIENCGFLYVTEEHSLVDYYRESTFNLDVQELEIIREKLKPLTEIDLKQKYGFGADKPTDLPVTAISYTTIFNSDSTIIYYPEENELPDEMDLFLHTISQIIFEKDTLKN
jgi:hypothetical protein